MTKEKAFISMPTLPVRREPPAENRQSRLISLVGLVFHSQPNESHPHPSHPWHFSHTSHCDWNSFYSSVLCESLYVCLLWQNKQVKHCDVNGTGFFLRVWCNRIHTSPCAMVESRVRQSRLKHFFPPVLEKTQLQRVCVFCKWATFSLNPAQTFLRTL